MGITGGFGLILDAVAVPSRLGDAVSGSSDLGRRPVLVFWSRSSQKTAGVWRRQRSRRNDCSRREFCPHQGLDGGAGRSAVCGLRSGARRGGPGPSPGKGEQGGLAIDGSSNRVNSSVEKALTWSRVVVRRTAMQGAGLLPMSTKFGDQGRLRDSRVQTEGQGRDSKFENTARSVAQSGGRRLATSWPQVGQLSGRSQIEKSKKEPIAASQVQQVGPQLDVE